MNSSRKLINVGSRQLMAFLEICRTQSFAKAAEQMAMSSSGMSMLVKELEAQLDARLFERTTRSVAMTDAGRRLRPVAQRIVDELGAVHEVIAGTQAAVRSRLDVAATPMVSASLLPAVMRAFADSHPHVRVHLADVDVSTVRSRVLQGEADLGLGFFVKPAVGLLRQPVRKFRLMRIGPPGGDPPGLVASRPWTSLAGVPLIGLPLDNPIQAVIDVQLAKIGRAHEPGPRMNLIGTLIAMVRAGMAHAVLPSFALDECLRQGLTVAMLTQPAVHLDLFLVSRRGDKAKPAAVAFGEALRGG